LLNINYKGLKYKSKNIYFYVNGKKKEKLFKKVKVDDNFIPCVIIADYIIKVSKFKEKDGSGSESE
jgi:hypothetical protein